LVERVSRQDGPLLVAEVGLITVVIAIAILRLADCILCGLQVSTFAGRMVVHVAYHTLSVSVIAIVSVIVAIFVSFICRFIVAWLLSACIVDGQVITPSLLSTLVTSIGIIVSIGLVRLSFFAHCHDNSLFFSRQFDLIFIVAYRCACEVASA
jgi:hypothetical protein